MAIKIWGAGSTSGSDTDWNTATNWDNDTLPVDGDSLLFDTTTSSNLLIGPTSAIYIENITMDSNASSYIAIEAYSYNPATQQFEDKYPLILYGQLINNSAFGAYLPAVAFGISQVVGAWDLYLVTITNPITYTASYNSKAYIAITSPTFNSSNYINFRGLSNHYDLKYGEGSSIGVVTGESTFVNFTISTSINVSGLYGIQSNTLNVNGFNLSNDPPYSIYASGMKEFYISAPTINITDIMDDLFIQTIMSNTSISVHYTSATIFNLHNTTIGKHQKTQLYPATVTINLTGYSRYMGTSDILGNTMMGQLEYSQANIIAGPGSSGTNVNLIAEDTSIVCGIYEDNAFRDGLLTFQPYAIFQLPSSYLGYNITMKDNSVFNGPIINSMFMLNTSISFLDNSNISTEYTLQSSGYNLAQNRVIVYGGFYPYTPPSTIIKKIYKASF